MIKKYFQKNWFLITMALVAIFAFVPSAFAQAVDISLSSFEGFYWFFGVFMFLLVAGFTMSYLRHKI